MRIGAFELREPLPEMSEAHVIAMLHPWLDAGSVGTLTLSRLESHYSAQELGKLDRPGNFFDFTRYRPITYNVEGKRSFTIPNSTIYTCPRKDGPDFVFFHLLEPHAFAEDYIESVMEVLKALKIKRYGRIGGMYDAVPHTRPLLINGTLNGEPITGVAGVTSQPRGRGNTYQGPTSIMNMITQELEKTGVETLSLMVRLPQYAQLEEDYAGTARLLEALCSLYQLPQEIVGNRRGRRQYREISAEVERNPAMKALVERLEAYYDSRSSAAEEKEEEGHVTLSPEVEGFLRDVTSQWDNPT